MKWNIVKIQENSQNPLTFKRIKTENKKLVFVKKNNHIEEIKEDIFAFKARVFLEKFENFAEVKKEDKVKGEPAYPYYDSEGIPTIGYGFNLAESSICELLENKLQFIGQEGKQEWSYYTKLAGHSKFDKPNPKEDKYILRQPDAFMESQNQNKEVWKSIVKKFDKNFQEKNEAGRDNPIPKEIILDKKELNQNQNQNQNKEYLTSILQKYFPFTISKENSRNFLASLIDERRHRLEATYRGAFNLDKDERFDSYEQLALLSLFYNREKLVQEKSSIGKAIKENNRFKVWFEIRYRSNGGKSKGIAKRRFAESNIFGLFDGIERGGFDNTADWSKKHTPTLQEIIEFMKFLYSPFRKEYDARVKENGQTKIIKKTTNNYIDYIKAYETEMVFDGINTLDFFKKCEKHDPTIDESKWQGKDLILHYVPYQEWFDKLFILLPTSSYHFPLSSISVFSQPLFHPNTSTPNITATESIKIALNPINKRLNQIRNDASLPNEAFLSPQDYTLQKVQSTIKAW